MLSPGSRHVYGPGGLHRALVDLLAAQFPPHQPEVPARRQQLPARGGELPAGQWLGVGTARLPVDCAGHYSAAINYFYLPFLFLP